MGWWPCTACTGPTSPCSFCSGTVPAEVDAVLGGVITGGAVEGDCDTTFAGSYTDIPRVGPCHWEVSQLSTTDPCTAGNPSANLSIGVTLSFDGTDYILTVFVAVSTTIDVATVTYEENLGTSKPDCNAWSSQNVSYLSSTGCCDFTNSTMLISAS